MSYYCWFNRNELLEKAHDKYHKEGGKEIAVIYYRRNKEDIKKKQRDRHKNMSKEENDIIKVIKKILSIKKTI